MCLHDNPISHELIKAVAGFCHAGEGSWEHLLEHLRKNFDLKMDAGALDSLDIVGIVLSILMEWAKKEDVTVRRFCDVSKEIGIPRVESIMQEAFVKFKTHSQLCTPSN